MHRNIFIIVAIYNMKDAINEITRLNNLLHICNLIKKVLFKFKN